MVLRAFSLGLICLGMLPLATGSSSDADLASVIDALEAKMQTLNAQIDIETLRVQNEKVDAGRRLSDAAGALDHMYLIICGALVMLMQAGFAMVEAGSCRAKNVQNIMMKNIMDVCLGTICWWSFGWTLAYGCYGDDDCKFAGTRQYFGHEFLEADEYGNQVALGPGGTAGADANPSLALEWFFQWAFCSAGATIVSGGVAERVKFHGYVVYTILMTTVIYPVVVAWHWGRGGWMAPSDEDGHINGIGFNDFAGSGIVHMTGGIGALTGAIIVGPRKGRFDGGTDFEPHSLPLVVLGTFILWFGWYGFNCGSTLGLSSLGTGQLAAIVAMNTTISASAGGLTAFTLQLIRLKLYDVGMMCNGILAGLVSITAGCGNVESGSAFAIGAIGGIVLIITDIVLKLVKVDDPVNAFAVHGAAGAWGVLAAALFDWGKGMDYYNGFGGGMGNAANAKDGKMDGQWAPGFAAAIVEIVVIIVWVGGLSTIIFLPLRLLGLLRATDEDQEMGMDTKEHSPSKAYAFTNMPSDRENSPKKEYQPKDEAAPAAAADPAQVEIALKPEPEAAQIGSAAKAGEEEIPFGEQCSI